MSVAELRTRFWPVTAGIAQRSLMLIPRVPSAFIPSLFFPLIMITAFAGAFGAVADIPGFPVRSMLDWILPMAVVQGGSFGGMTIAFGVARDLENGFFDRILLSPAPRRSLMSGLLLAAGARAAVTFPGLVVIGFLIGMHTPGGPPGMLTLFVATIGSAIAFSSFGLAVALRLKSQAAAPLMQMPVFLSVFLSTGQMPIEQLSGWLHTVARFNPMTNVLALARAGFVGEVTWAATWPGLVALAGLFAVFGGLAARALQRTVR